MRVENRKYQQYDVASCFLVSYFFIPMEKKMLQVVLFDTFNRSISEYSSSETLKKHFLSFKFELCFFLSGDDVRRVDINHNKQQLIMTEFNLLNNFFLSFLLLLFWTTFVFKYFFPMWNWKRIKKKAFVVWRDILNVLLIA